MLLTLLIFRSLTTKVKTISFTFVRLTEKFAYLQLSAHYSSLVIASWYLREIGMLS